MAWYDDRSRTEFVGSYANSKQFQRDLQMAARRGWIVQGGAEGTGAASASPSHKVTATFLRPPDWLVNREREIAEALRADAAKAADDKEATLVRALEALGRAEQVFASWCPANITADVPASVEAERELLAACKDMISKRQRVLRALDETLKEMGAAVALGVSEFTATLSRYRTAREIGIARLESELELLRGQESVAVAAREWLRASDRQRAAEVELRKRSTELRVREAELAANVDARNDAVNALIPIER